MPITQERILSLVREFEFTLSVHHSFLSNLERLAKSLEVQSPETSQLIRAEILSLPFISTDALRDERKHYNSTALRNEKSRKIMERKRRLAGVPERRSIQYRINAEERARGLGEERAYREFMQGTAITKDNVRAAEAKRAAAQVAQVYDPRAEARIAQLESAGKEIAQRNGDDEIVPPESLVPLPIDDSSANPAQWSPERLAAEAARGSINMDDEI